MKILEWIKEKLGIENNRKLYNNLLMLLFMGIVLVIVSNFYKDITYKNKNAAEENNGFNNQGSVTYKSNDEYFYKEKLEEELAGILSKIAGVGKVSVMITYESGKELVTQKDKSITDKVTDEKDNAGGTRIINESSVSEKTVMVNQQGGSSEPLIVKEINPQIRGVIVVAEGAWDSKVKRKISQAVQTVLDIPAYRVTVLETNK
ncbi:MAG TPA: stage III sporulation protein AG [Clostridiales bacterium]|nr:stage III sporulation protein AG [Clostridiales bacterium]